MPTYSVISVEGCLDATKRAKIASEITRIHSKTTGAPTYFAQVIFTEIAPDRYFLRRQSAERPPGLCQRPDPRGPLCREQGLTHRTDNRGGGRSVESVEAECLGLHHRSRATADSRVRSCPFGSRRRGALGGCVT